MLRPAALFPFVRVLSLAVLILSAVLSMEALAGVEVVLYGPEQFFRDPAAPQGTVRNFAVLRPVAQSYLLKVDNGSMEGDSAVSSAVISLNGTVVLRQSDFSQNVFHLERPVVLSGSNTLEVRLNSIPTSFITISITCALPRNVSLLRT